MPLIVPLIALLICPGAVRPVPGDVLREFAPQGAYAGHWGVDLASGIGSPVRAARDGIVTFAGPVAGRISVTIRHGGGVRTSYSYLSDVAVGAGAPVRSGSVIGHSGVDHGIPAVHFSLRLGDRYLDPLPWLSCSGWVPGDGVRLAPVATGRPWACGGSVGAC